MSTAILILAEEPVVAALVGMLVELAGYQPVFAERGEQPVEAIARVRPRVVALIDVALDDALSDLFFVHAAKRQLGVALFGSAHREVELERVAASRGIPWFTLPPDLTQLKHSIEAAATSEWWSRRVERRQPAVTGQAPDGALTFLDTAGNRWMVYDRRRDPAPVPSRPGAKDPVVVERHFVSAAGKRFSCELQVHELDHPTPATLEEQLARAQPL